MNDRIRDRIVGLQALPGAAPWAVPPPSEADVTTTGQAAPSDRLRVELVGMHLRVAGLVETAGFDRLSDLVNLRESVELTDVVLLAGLGQETRIVFPELRVRLADVSIIGQREASPRVADAWHRIAKRSRHLVVMTVAHMVQGSAYLHPEASLASFVDSPNQRFMPMTDVHVRWLPDRRLAARYPFALVQGSHIIGVATDADERTGARTKAARALYQARTLD